MRLRILIIAAILTAVGLFAGSHEAARVGLSHVRALVSMARGRTSLPPTSPSLTDQVFAMQGYRTALIRLAPEHPEDWRLWLASAEVQSFARATGQDTGEPARTAYENAARAAPQNAAVHSRAAVWYAVRVDAGRPEEAARQGRRPEEMRAHFTAQDMAGLVVHAQRGRVLEPDNALYDQLLAYAALTKREDGQALRLLRQAASKPGWDDHSREVEQAVIFAVEKAGYPRAGSLLASGEVLYYTPAVVRRIARIGAAKGAAAAASGDVAEALAWYESTWTMGAAMMDHAQFLIQYLSGVAITRAAMNRMVSRGEVDRVLKVARLQPWLELYSIHALVRSEMAEEGFRSYLRQHGQTAFADKVLVQMAAAREVIGQTYKAQHDPLSEPMGKAPTVLAAAWNGQVWALAEALIVLVLWCLGWAFGRPLLALGAPRTRWGARAALVIGLAVAVACVGLALWLRWDMLYEASLHQPPTGRVEVGRTVMTLVLPVVLVLAIMLMSAGWRGLRAGDSSLALWSRNIVRGLPIAALAFFILYLLLFIPVSAAGRRVTAYFGGRYTRGEMAMLLNPNPPPLGRR